MKKDVDFDVAIIGAGPAGCAAAIYAASKGLNVALFESTSEPKARPGESLPPGVEPLFRQLGIWDDIEALHCLRNPGHFSWTIGEQEKIFHPYGQDAHGVWQDFQIPRIKLDNILQKRARALGVQFFSNHHVRKLEAHGEVIAIQINGTDTLRATYYIDATGSHLLFCRTFNIKLIKHSPRFIVRFGYQQHNRPYEQLPIFIKDKNGWYWHAEVEHDRYAWVRLTANNVVSNKKKLSGGADVTWRIAEKLAGPQFFLVGDAACMLDPSAGHGVLRALMTGMMAAYVIDNILKNNITHTFGCNHYTQWVNQWFMHDVQELQKRFL